MKAHSVPSAYPDTFDYGVYDRLREKFGDNQPRGGVIFKTTLKLVNHHSSCSKCHYAFEVDTYGRGCIHDCVYCYSLELLTGRGYWNRPHPFPVDIGEIRKIFATVFESDRNSKWRAILSKRVPLRLGSMSDCFMKIDRKYKVTRELLRILKFYDYPYIIFTRSDMVADDDYLKLLVPSLASVQFSISGGNEALTKALEPGAPSVMARLSALEKLAVNGIWTSVRINPLFPRYPDGYYTDRASLKQRFANAVIPEFPLFDLSFVEQLSVARVPSVVVGFVRLSPMAINSITRVTGINFGSFFKPEVLRGQYDRHYSDSEVAFYYKTIQSECAKLGIRFNTCYIGNGQKDYYQYQHFWSNKLDCCDSRGNVDGFRASSQEIEWPLRYMFSSQQEAARATRTIDEQFEEQYAIPGTNRGADGVSPSVR